MLAYVTTLQGQALWPCRWWSTWRYQDIELPFDPPPDLAIEVDITRSSMDKLSICAALGIVELWRYRGGAIEVYVLQDSGQYRASELSRVLPEFPIDEVNRLLENRGASNDTQLVRSFRAWIRENRVAS